MFSFSYGYGLGIDPGLTLIGMAVFAVLLVLWVRRRGRNRDGGEGK
ncbi:hypothetical protein [Celeribacter indicus]|nr:hypothetical protein [Celeribacter indicus]SDW57117.1 hypothetical protein SAMN05443573_104295 [Celeribacter indicus]